MVTKNKYPEKLDYNSNNNIALLWCPLLYAFPGYAFKRANINLHSLVGKVKEKKLKKEYLIEELSENEKNFLKANHIDLSGDTYEIETGMNLYGDLVNNLKYYNYEDDMCHVAGISGHSILHFTLGQIFNIDYRAILFGQLLEMTPMHHSMTEVYWAANDMGFLPLFENYADMRNRINEIIINYSTEINLLTIYDSPFQPISVKSIRGGLKRNIRK
jgi:hypothetical protein